MPKQKFLVESSITIVDSVENDRFNNNNVMDGKLTDIDQKLSLFTIDISNEIKVGYRRPLRTKTPILILDFIQLVAGVGVTNELTPMTYYI